MDEVIARWPDAAPKIHMVKQFGINSEEQACEDLDIADPIGMDESFYEEIFSLIKKEMERIARIL
jgi:protein-tyrosine-phosphatase